MGWLALASIYAMDGFITDDSHCVLVYIAMGLHIAVEFIGAAKLSTRHILQGVSVCSAPSWNTQHKTHICELVLVGLPVLEFRTTKYDHVYLPVFRILGASSLLDA